MTGTFTNNWHGLKNAMLLGGYYQNGFSTVYNTNGQRLNGQDSSYSSRRLASLISLINNAYTTINDRISVRLGTSDTTPLASDYNLGTPWSSNISYVSASATTPSFDSTTHKVSRTYTLTIQNTAAATTTVREFGLFTVLSATTNSGDVMLYRGILEEPVTLRQYESATIEFTIEMTLDDPF